jgi:hypothetical protein
MPDFGIMRGFNEKLFGDKLVAGQLPTQLGLIGILNIGLLLDTYPNAAAAYSLRQLSSAYSGSAIRVRRSSDNAEQNIGFDGSGNLDTTALTSFCSGTNGFVTTWYDQSGNSRNATQTTAANQPQIVSSGSVINVNGKPSLDYTSSINVRLVTSASLSNSNSLTMTTIAKINNPSVSYKYAWSIGTSDGTGYAAFIPIAGTSFQDWITNDMLFWGNGFNSTSSPRIISQGLQYTSGNQYLNFGVLGTTNVFNINNSTITTRVNTTANCSYSGVISIGNSNSLTEGLLGNLQEVVFWQNDLSANRSGINSNTNTYYGIY